MNNDKDSYDGFTVAGTDIEEVKRRNAESGLSYNEVKALLAKTAGTVNTSKFSDTNAGKVRNRNQQGTQN
ncbi:gamma-type small acid-soluble spore protein [Oceanobacillus halophilus]|uniref:Gamma-type small acid-soluble spore protein n=1 Tax=Oceanobacillus halophilus TaxID=930130 RepID=A0A495A063_9BACI|nr:gamma-type small acid-soluble spore protein [Oceanobacillus halophilus]RKQ32665.1 gamma-type small acid-soluble spore protein [Oceanobacillus halophilus]